MRSIDSKMDVLRMIDILDANSKVGEVSIGLRSDIKWNSEILRMIIDRYTNVYTIYVRDDNT